MPRVGSAVQRAVLDDAAGDIHRPRAHTISPEVQSASLRRKKASGTTESAAAADRQNTGLHRGPARVAVHAREGQSASVKMAQGTAPGDRAREENRACIRRNLKRATRHQFDGVRNAGTDAQVFKSIRGNEVIRPLYPDWPSAQRPGAKDPQRVGSPIPTEEDAAGEVIGGVLKVHPPTKGSHSHPARTRNFACEENIPAGEVRIATAQEDGIAHGLRRVTVGRDGRPVRDSQQSRAEPISISEACVGGTQLHGPGVDECGPGVGIVITIVVENERAGARFRQRACGATGAEVLDDRVERQLVGGAIDPDDNFIARSRSLQDANGRSSGAGEAESRSGGPAGEQSISAQNLPGGGHGDAVGPHVDRVHRRRGLRGDAAGQRDIVRSGGTHRCARPHGEEIRIASSVSPHKPSGVIRCIGAAIVEVAAIRELPSRGSGGEDKAVSERIGAGVDEVARRPGGACCQRSKRDRLIKSRSPRRLHRAIPGAESQCAETLAERTAGPRVVHIKSATARKSQRTRRIQRTRLAVQIHRASIDRRRTRIRIRAREIPSARAALRHRQRSRRAIRDDATNRIRIRIPPAQIQHRSPRRAARNTAAKIQNPRTRARTVDAIIGKRKSPTSALNDHRRIHVLNRIRSRQRPKNLHTPAASHEQRIPARSPHEIIPRSRPEADSAKTLRRRINQNGRTHHPPSIRNRRIKQRQIRHPRHRRIAHPISKRGPIAINDRATIPNQIRRLRGQTSDDESGDGASKNAGGGAGASVGFHGEKLMGVACGRYAPHPRRVLARQHTSA